ncbi:hypothetical protein Taro_030612 [Colocasia esculenta]|uniref:Thioredoxin-like fold domain-containing protein n=1 Tax=Colocasia esculenta TaxID=4460 RepID=A0A843W3U3_COLES|nr:hypothetical protein [Colocasia esculenta]
MRRAGAAPSLFLSLVLLFFALCCCGWWSSPAQALIPARYDGFVYGVGTPVREDSIVVEAFFDPLCPDSRDAWSPLKQVLHEYSPRVFLVVHPFPLPYHENSFLSCRALHIANKLNTSTTYLVLELFFKHQEKLYNKPTQKMSRESVTGHIINLAVEAMGDSSTSAFQKGFEDPKTDRAARNSFNYGCSRGVTGTPFFLVNGFALPGAGSAVGYEKWRSIIDPLLSEHSPAGEEVVPPFI